MIEMSDTEFAQVTHMSMRTKVLLGVRIAGMDAMSITKLADCPAILSLQIATTDETDFFRDLVEFAVDEAGAQGHEN